MQFFFWNYANYGLRAELCDFASTHNSGSPVYYITSSLPISASHETFVWQIGGFDWRMLSLMGSADRAPLLLCEI